MHDAACTVTLVIAQQQQQQHVLLSSPPAAAQHVRICRAGAGCTLLHVRTATSCIHCCCFQVQQCTSTHWSHSSRTPHLLLRSPCLPSQLTTCCHAPPSTKRTCLQAVVQSNKLVEMHSAHLILCCDNYLPVARCPATTHHLNPTYSAGHCAVSQALYNALYGLHSLP